MVTSNVSGPFKLPTSYTRRQYTPTSYTLVICGVDPADAVAVVEGVQPNPLGTPRPSPMATDGSSKPTDRGERYVDRAVLGHRERKKAGAAHAHRGDVAFGRRRRRWRPRRRGGRVVIAAGGREQGQSGCRAQRGGLPAEFHKRSDTFGNNSTVGTNKVIKHGTKTHGCRPLAAAHFISTSNWEIWSVFFAKLTFEARRGGCLGLARRLASTAAGLGRGVGSRLRR